jgi:hypothetical protein
MKVAKDRRPTLCGIAAIELGVASQEIINQGLALTGVRANVNIRSTQVANPLGSALFLAVSLLWLLFPCGKLTAASYTK